MSVMRVQKKKDNLNQIIEIDVKFAFINDCKPIMQTHALRSPGLSPLIASLKY